MDKITKALALNNEIKVSIAKTKEIANQALKLHDLWPSSISVLAKTLTLGAIMGKMLKGHDALTIKINGNGPIGNIVVDANALGEVRGYVDNPHVNFINNSNILDDKTAIGLDGFIEVIKTQNLKTNFSSSVEIKTGDLANDFTYYFFISEQALTIILLNLSITKDASISESNGLLIQVLPKASEETLNFLEKTFEGFKDTASLLSKTPTDILNTLFKDDYSILEESSLIYNCNCSKTNFSKGLATLSKKDLKHIIDEDEKAEITCNYCKKVYNFSKEDLIDILNKK